MAASQANLRHVGSIRGRLLRSGAVAAISVVVGAAAHGIAGGPLPPAERLILLTLIATGAAFPVYRRSAPGPAAVPLLGLAQSVLHPAFIWAAGTPGDEHANHSAHSGASGMSMLVAHLAAGLVAAALVVLTDRLLTAAVRMRLDLLWDRLWDRLLAVRPGLPPPVDRFVTAIPSSPPTRGRRSAFIHPAPRRGHPSPAAT
jgi:hypothetical protein